MVLPNLNKCAHQQFVKTLILIAFLPVVMLACTPLFTAPELNKLYQLKPITEAYTTLPNINWRLGIEHPKTTGGLQSRKIAMRPDSHQIEYISGARWIEPLPAMLQTLILESFENSGKFKYVGRQTTSLNADYLLLSEVRDFHLMRNDVTLKRKIVIKIRVTLVDRWKKNVLHETTIIEQHPVKNLKMESVIAGFDQATQNMLQKLTRWTLENGAQLPCKSCQ